MLNKLHNNFWPIFLTFFACSPLFACMLNLLKINPAFIWYVPNLLMLIYAIIIVWKNKNRLFSKKILPLTLFFLVAFLSSLLAKDKIASFFGNSYRLEGFLTYLGYLGFFIWGTKIIEKKQLNKFIKLFIGGGALISFLTLFDTTLTRSLFDIPEYEYYFYSGPFYHYNHFAYYLLIVNICAVYKFLQSHGIKKIGYFFINCLLLYVFTINNTFGAYLGYLIGILILVLALIFRKKHLFTSLVLIVSIILIAMFTYREGVNIVLNNFNELYNDIQRIWKSDYFKGEFGRVLVPYEVKADLVLEENDVDDFVYFLNIGNERFRLWYYGIKIIKERPLLGYGFDSSASEYMKYNIYQTRPHNLLIEMTLNVGLLGLVLYGINIIIVLKKGLKNIKGNNIFIFISLVVILAYLVSSMFGNSTYYVAPYFYLFLGILYRGDCDEI